MKPDETELTAAAAAISNSIDLKVDKTVFDTTAGAINSTLSQKANTIDVNTSLATKYSIAEVNALVVPKADSAVVNAALALKADSSALEITNLGLTTKANQSTTYTKSETDSLLTFKSNTTDVTTALGFKVDKTYVDPGLALKSTQAYVDEGLLLKANKTYVDLQLGQKASIGYVDEQVIEGIAGIANSAPLALDTLKELSQALNNDSNYATTVQTQLGDKADKSTTYTKTEVDGAMLLKSTKPQFIRNVKLRLT